MTDRKARLAALAAKAGRSIQAKAVETTADTAAAPQTEGEAGTDTVKVKFRNYTPSNKTLEETSSDSGTTWSKRQRTDNAPEKLSVLDQALEKAKAEGTTHNSTRTNTEGETHKINADLKRDIAPKLARLNKRTQKAILSLLRERLAKEAADDIA